MGDKFQKSFEVECACNRATGGKIIIPLTVKNTYKITHNENLGKCPVCGEKYKKLKVIKRTFDEGLTKIIPDDVVEDL